MVLLSSRVILLHILVSKMYDCSLSKKIYLLRLIKSWYELTLLSKSLDRNQAGCRLEPYAARPTDRNQTP